VHAIGIERASDLLVAGADCGKRGRDLGHTSLESLLETDSSTFVRVGERQNTSWRGFRGNLFYLRVSVVVDV
jgi:hypothetical protein